MATTQLFVELLIIGIGVAIWLAFLGAVVFRLPWESPLPELRGIHLAALAGVAYVVGIVVDRLAWSGFRFVESRHRDRVFGVDHDPPAEDREKLVQTSSSSLRDQIAYNRSRLRICRSWILNFALTGVWAGVWAIQQHSWTIGAIAITGLTFSALTAYTATLLSRDHYLNIRHSYEFLIRMTKSSGAEEEERTPQTRQSDST